MPMSEHGTSPPHRSLLGRNVSCTAHNTAVVEAQVAIKRGQRADRSAGSRRACLIIPQSSQGLGPSSLRGHHEAELPLEYKASRCKLYASAIGRSAASETRAEKFRQTSTHLRCHPLGHLALDHGHIALHPLLHQLDLAIADPPGCALLGLAEFILVGRVLLVLVV